DQPFGPVLGDDGDPVAAFDAVRAQAARQPAGGVRRLPPGDRLVAAVALGPEEGPVAQAICRLEKHLGEALPAPIAVDADHGPSPGPPPTCPCRAERPPG